MSDRKAPCRGGRQTRHYRHRVSDNSHYRHRESDNSAQEALGLWQARRPMSDSSGLLLALAVGPFRAIARHSLVAPTLARRPVAAPMGRRERLLRGWRMMVAQVRPHRHKLAVRRTSCDIAVRRRWRQRAVGHAVVRGWQIHLRAAAAEMARVRAIGHSFRLCVAAAAVVLVAR